MLWIHKIHKQQQDFIIVCEKECEIVGTITWPLVKKLHKILLQNIKWWPSLNIYTFSERQTTLFSIYHTYPNVPVTRCILGLLVNFILSSYVGKNIPAGHHKDLKRN